MNLQEIYNHHAVEMLEQHKPTLISKCATIAIVLYSYSAWSKAHKDTKNYIETEMQVQTHLTTEPRLHLLMDMQHACWYPDFPNRMKSLVDIAQDFNLETNILQQYSRYLK